MQLKKVRMIAFIAVALLPFMALGQAQKASLQPEDVLDFIGARYKAFTLQKDIADAERISCRLDIYENGEVVQKERVTSYPLIEPKDEEQRFCVIFTENEENFDGLVRFVRGSARFSIEKPKQEKSKSWTWTPEVNMDEQGRVVLAFQLPPEDPRTTPERMTADGAYRAFVMQVKVK